MDKILSIILQILSSLPGIITTAEAVFKGKPGSGALKKDLVLTTVRAATDVAATAGVKELQNAQTKDALVSAAGALTDGVVAALNVAQVFRHEGGS